MESTSAKLSDEEVSAAKEDLDPNSDLHKKLRRYFDQVSESNPQIAQAYIYGTELEDGNKTSIVSMPTHVLEMFEEAGMKLGDMYEQPQFIADSVAEMVSTGETTYSKVYQDDYGTWVSVLKPYKNAQGEIIAYYALDIDASMVAKGKQALLLYSSLALLVILVIVITLQYFIVRKTILPLRELGEGIESFSAGRFDIELKESEDEIGGINKKFNQMVKNMHVIVSSIHEAYERNNEYSGKLLTAVTEGSKNHDVIANHIDNISERMKTQETATGESATSLNEIVSGITTIADYSSEVRNKSDAMEERSKKGNEIVQESIAQLKSVEVHVGDSSQALHKLSEKSNEISDIVVLITEIANQTNLLALNAAIEAARAGEHGRGFAVVADEVRKLAEQSKESAEQIKELISIIQIEVETAVSSISDGVNAVSSSVITSEEIRKVFAQFLGDINGMGGQIQEISAATQQIAAESEEVAAIVEQLSSTAEQNTETAHDINHMTQQQNKNMRMIAADAEEMKSLFQKLRDSISIFKL
ncbi:methyl-accepting chemotaxis protein [Bacillus kandeliae]